MAKSGLEGDGSPITRCPSAPVRGRDGNEHLPFSCVWVGQEGTESLLLGASQSRQEHHPAFEHERGWDGAIALAVEGATNSDVFETYVERVLAPTLRKGQVVMDNLSAHKGERVREPIEKRGCELMYLPPYSPDFNRIEEAFSKIKGLFLRKAEARSRQTLLEAIGAAISALSAKDARGFFAHCGYRVMVQPF
jgi:transposase